MDLRLPALAACSLVSPLLGVDGQPDRRPNIILIQCDDLGWDDLGLHGNDRVHTPNLDALGRASARFTSFTVNPVSAPSRATLLTGRHFLRTGVSHVHGGKDYLHLDERTLADNLRAAGYATGMWGKWHSGSNPGYFPWERGFSEAYVANLYRHRSTSGLFNGEPVQHQGWADEVMADQVIDFMRRHRDRPFFAYLPTMTPHSPHDAPDHWVQHYLDQGLSAPLSRLWGMVSFLDEQLARVFAEVELLELSGHTVIVFKSDNGPAIEGSSLNDEDRRLRRVSNMRGWKGDIYENGVRSPLFIYWPGTIEPHEFSTPIDLVDLAPTLLEIAGAQPVAEALPMDGTSFLPMLLNREERKPAPIFNYAHRGWLTSGPPYSLDGIPGEYLPINPIQRAALPFYGQSLSIRRGDYKLLLNSEFADVDAGGRVRLFDLATDPLETTDIGPAHPELRDSLLNELRHWWQEIVSEPHAFTAPVFQMRPGANRIPARAPTEVQGAVFNRVTDLRGWSGVGDKAVYRINSPSEAVVTVTLQWREPNDPKTIWALAIAEQGDIHLFSGTEPVTLNFPAGISHLQLRLHQLPESASPPPPLQVIHVQW